MPNLPNLQTLIVAALVPACAFYVVWTLMPAAGRRGLARRLIGLPWPAPAARRLQAAATSTSGCGCDGCDRAPKSAPRRTANDTPAPAEPAVRPLVFHPRRQV